jgi:glutathione reductase (NADPH)
VFEGPHEIHLLGQGRTVSAERILVATGGVANQLESLPGHQYCITSNETFHLESLPKAIVIYGGGYIAVEFACIFAGLGVTTTLIYRGDHILRGFDHDVSGLVQETMIKRGVRVILNRHFTEVEASGIFGRRVKLDDGTVIDCETVMLAAGRLPYTAGLGLEKAGVETGHKGEIKVDPYSRSSVPFILAVGDVTDRMALTPVAIHEAMCLIETEFRDNPTSPDHELVPTAVFSQPEIGTVGLPEYAACMEYERLNIFLARFTPMKNTLAGRDEKMVMKIIVDADNDRVIGVHIAGPEAGEMAQTLAIALKMGATKADFDRTMALHPTAAEELVTMYQPSYRIVNGERVD